MSDWTEATDPVPARREKEITPAEAARRRRRAERMKGRGSLLLFAGTDRLDGHAIEPDFDDMGA